MSTDRELIIQARAGDQAAFAELYEHHRVVLYRTALAIVRNPEAAEEVLQDTYVRLHRNLGKIHDELPLLPWMYRVTVNLSCAKIDRRLALVQSIERFAQVLFANDQDEPAGRAEAGEQAAAVRDALESLSGRHRAVVVLYYWREMSLREISEIMQCPVGTVKSRLHYAARVLRRVLEGDPRLLPEILIHAE